MGPLQGLEGARLQLLLDAIAQLAGLSGGGGDTGGVVAVSGPLTDDELRAAAVLITGALTDAELRASPLPVVEPWTEYEAIAADSADQAAGAAGAAGDYLSHIVIQPAAAEIGDVVVKDDATVIFTRTGGDTLPDLSPIIVPFGVKSKNGAWKLTTGADVSVLACGDFT